MNGQLVSIDGQGVLHMIMGFYRWSGGFEDGQGVLQIVRRFRR